MRKDSADLPKTYARATFMCALIWGNMFRQVQLTQKNVLDISVLEVVGGINAPPMFSNTS